MRKPGNYAHNLVRLILALVGLMGGLAAPVCSRGRQLTYQAADPLDTQ